MFSSVSAPFCCPMTTIRRPSSRARPGDHRVVVAEEAVAVELDEVVGHRLDELERPRTAQVARELDARPDGVARVALGQRVRGASVASSDGRRPFPHPFGDRAQERQRPEARGVDVGGEPDGRIEVARRERAEQVDQLGAQLGAGHDPVDEAVVEQELGALEPVGQLLGDGPGRDARAGEPDERVRFGHVDVADRRERGEHAAGRRVGQDGDERHAGRAQTLERGHRLGQLHERERALLHPRPARRADDDERGAGREGVLRGAGHLLADDRAHRAAHEPEVHDAQRDGRAAERARPPHGGVAHPGRGLGGDEAIRIGLLVDEPETVDRLETRVALGPGPGVEQQVEPRRGRQPEVVAAGRADAERLVELLVEQHRLARRALGPQVGRVDVAAGAERRQLDRHQTGLVRATARAARAIGPAAGRLRRQATYAAPAIDSAAEVRAPPMISGRPTANRGSGTPAAPRSRRPGRPDPGAARPGPRRRPRSRRASARRPRRAAPRAPPRTGTTGGAAAGRAPGARPWSGWCRRGSSRPGRASAPRAWAARSVSR